MKHINTLLFILGLVTVCPSAMSQNLSMDCLDSVLTLCAPDPRIQLPSSNQSIVGLGTPGATSCSVHVRFGTQVSGDCGIIVKYYVEMLPFDGSSRIRIQDTTEVFLDQGTNEAQTILDTRLLGTSAVLADGIPYNSACPEDAGAYHRLWWYAIDECGDIDSCTMLLRLEDCLPPIATPVGVTMVVFPVDQQITITAKDLVESAVDDCNPINWLLYSFDPNVFLPTKTINCDTIAANGGPLFQFDIWVGDRGPDRNCNGVNEWTEFNKVKLQALVAVDDDCAGEIFDGTVLSENMVPVEDVLISFFGDGPVQTVTTDSDGEYRLPEIDTNQDWTIFPSKTGDERAGISTLDLIKIQKHLLGLELFDSPYKRIAADANNSRSISAVDLLELQKLILQVTSTLPNNTSWRFVPRSYEFPDSTNPWPFDEQSDLDELDFVGIKVGDVNGTITAPRDPFSTIDLLIPERSLNSGLARIPVIASSSMSLSGLQLTLGGQGAAVLSLESGRLGIARSDYALHGNALLLSWYDGTPEMISPGDTLFNVRVDVRDPMMTSQLLSIHSRRLASEAYVHNNGSELTYELKSKFVSDNDAGIVIYPNPTTGECNIVLSGSNEVITSIQLYNSAGQRVYHREQPTSMRGGYPLNGDRTWPAGAYLAVVRTDQGKTHTSMIIIGQRR